MRKGTSQTLTRVRIIEHALRPAAPTLRRLLHATAKHIGRSIYLVSRGRTPTSRPCSNADLGRARTSWLHALASYGVLGNTSKPKASPLAQCLLAMERQQLDDWQLASWSDETFDALWSPDFSTTNTTFEFRGAEPPVAGINDSNTSNKVCTDEIGSNASLGRTSAQPSPSCTLDMPSRQAMAQYERSLEQRKHTLPRRRSRYLLRRAGSRSSPIAIPTGAVSPYPSGTQSLAMQRWENSPPEDEAASLSAICNALDNRSIGMSPQTSRPSSRDAFHKYRGPSSTTSLDSAASETSIRSWNSGNSAASHTHRRGQAPKSRSKAKAKATGMNAADRIFKCTFCCDTFKHKYDWSRHEKSLHLNMEEWVCTPNGGSVLLPLTGRVHCAYCSALDPTTEHLQQHNHSACLESRSTPRVFRRKDHLVQHLRLVHGLDTLPLIADWKVESLPVTSRCGFCNAALNSWDERADHLAAHFRGGKTMADWEGNHGFEPAVTARLTNAFPPYLIAAQSTTLIPFSATDPAALDHTNQLLSRIELEATGASYPTSNEQGDHASPWTSYSQTLPTQQEVDTSQFADILSRHLSRFAREQMRLGVVPTDEMFQRESRRLLYYDGDDNWNQTVADDPKWLQEFRQRTGYGEEAGV
jgi:hypothetical protein